MVHSSAEGGKAAQRWPGNVLDASMQCMQNARWRAKPVQVKHDRENLPQPDWRQYYPEEGTHLFIYFCRRLQIYIKVDRIA